MGTYVTTMHHNAIVIYIYMYIIFKYVYFMHGACIQVGRMAPIADSRQSFPQLPEEVFKDWSLHAIELLTICEQSSMT